MAEVGDADCFCFAAFEGFFHGFVWLGERGVSDDFLRGGKRVGRLG